MHMRGEPRTMQADPQYGDVVAEVADWLVARADAAMAAGVARGRIWLDPGIGFGKTATHNLALTAQLERLAATGFPVLYGASRKRTIQSVDPTATDPADRLGGSLALALAAARAGASILRVHDVRETVQALGLVRSAALPHGRDMPDQPPYRGRVLIIAGSDSGGGAGLQADIKAVTLLGGYAATAITAITVQNTLGVHGVHPLPLDLIEAQARAVLDDIGTDAIKTGMLGSTAVVERVAAILDSSDAPAVVDPVMIAKGGAALLADDAVAAVRSLMIPRAALLTPNAPEAEALTGITVADLDGQRRAGEALLAMGARAVLMKGGHVPGETVVDLLLTPSGETLLEGERFDTRNTHGTGCTLASACAAGLAKGLPLEAAVAEAWAYVAEAIRRAPGLGGGHGPLDHGWPLRRDA